MNEQQSLEKSNWEARVQELTHAFPYPPTPDVAGAVRRRLATRPAPPTLYRQRLAWTAAAAVVFILVGLIAMPTVQARVLDMLGLGAGHSLLAGPTPTFIAPTMTVTELPSPTSMLLTATPQPSSTPLSSAQTMAQLPALPIRPEVTRASVFP